MNDGEIMYELDHSGEAPPQCVACNQPAEHQCECRQQVCREHSFECEFCHKRFCAVHVTEIEENFFVCEADMPAFLKEAAAVMASDRVEAEVMA